MAVHQNRYELLERIGVGGMAEVYRARMVGPAGFEKVVALKRILEDYGADQDFLHRFVDEARLTAKLQHPNICQVLDFGVIDDRYYLTLEFVHGLDLAQVIARLEYHGDLLPSELCLVTAAGVLRGLGHAHRAVDELGRDLGIVHRDVSPQNVLLSVNGDIKLSDFGAAKADAAVRQARTQENIALGKLAYMAPEQRKGKAVDGRADVYGVGVLLVEMLEGPTLFRRNTGLSGIDREQLVTTAEERFPAAIAPQIAQLLAIALEPTPDRRFSDAMSMLAAVERCAASLGRRGTTDQLGDLVRRLMEDAEFATNRFAQGPAPTPIPVVTTSLTAEPSSEASSIEEGVHEIGDDSFEDAIKSEGIDSLEEALDSSDVAYAPTQVAVPPSSPSGAVEELATQVIRGGQQSDSSAATRIIKGHNAKSVDSVETSVIQRDQPVFEDLQTQVMKGSTGSEKTVEPGAESPVGPTPLVDSGPPTLPTVPGVALRGATPPPTLPVIRGSALRGATPPPSEAPSQGEPASADVATSSPAAADAEHVGPSPTSTRPSEPPGQQPPTWGASVADEPSAESSLTLDDDARDDENEPTHVVPAPTGWNDEDLSAGGLPATSQPVEHRQAAAQPQQHAPARRSGVGQKTSVVRRSSSSKRSFRILLVVLVVAIGLALWGAFAIINWFAERNRAPWPIETSAPSESPASASPSLSATAGDESGTTAAPEAAADANVVGSSNQGDSSANGDTPTEPDEQPLPARQPGREEGPQRASAPAQETERRPAMLTILSDPPGRAYIDGGLVTSRTPLRGHEIAPGTYIIRLVFTSTGDTRSRRVHIDPGEHEVVRFTAEE